MKIAIASDDEKTISSHFGRTRGFVVFEVEGREVKNQEYRPNTFTGHAGGLEGAGHGVDRHGPIVSALSDCKAAISHGMGRRIYDDLKNAGIEVFVTDETDVRRTFDLYVQGGLTNHPERSCSHEHER
ncbi:MAG: NifB/NifX family molybdenum-iron cluster-binding protein [Candidatus Edwardsbacteria bacterium]